MTGFSRARKALAEAEAVVSLKSVNHRGLDMHFHMPPMLDPFEPRAREAIRKRLVRGHVQVNVTIEKQAGPGAQALNRELLDRWMTAYREAANRMDSPAPPDPNAALRIPGMLQTDSRIEWSEELGQALDICMEEALTALDEFRCREGSAIAEEMRGRVKTLADLAGKMQRIRAQATAAFQSRLRERLNELLGTAQIEPHRLAHETAILVDRSDVSEEIMRLTTHASQVLDLLNASGEKGKKLDFLLQEMNRETNTILSKTGGLGDQGLTLTNLALAAKAEIDKMREQSLNLE